ncbi:MAG TPA: hypothetical protein VNO31_21485, partial [Umezawaea sp.]|nr:hypothetical protein [Umezawaea sp.]
RGVRTTTTTLEPLPDADMATLLRTFRDAWLPSRDGGHAETPWDPPPSTAMTALEQLIPRAGGNPGLGISLSRELVHRYHLYQEVALDEQSHSEALVPIARAGLGISSTIRAVARSCMDGLSVRLKTVLLDAAVLGAGISLFPLAVLGGVGANEVAPFLHRLVEDGFLRLSGRNSATGHPEYEFRSEILREVAYSHLPRAVRAAKHGAAADWMARSDADDRDTERALHHRWWAAALEEADRRPAAFSLR